MRLEVKDFYGKAHAENRVILQLPPGDFREQLTLANPERYGFFNVLAEVVGRRPAIGWAPSSFCVLEKSEPDPFFDLNELQGGDHTWLPDLSVPGLRSHQLPLGLARIRNHQPGLQEGSGCPEGTSLLRRVSEFRLSDHGRPMPRPAPWVPAWWQAP